MFLSTPYIPAYWAKTDSRFGGDHTSGVGVGKGVGVGRAVIVGDGVGVMRGLGIGVGVLVGDAEGDGVMGMGVDVISWAKTLGLDETLFIFARK